MPNSIKHIPSEINVYSKLSGIDPTFVVSQRFITEFVAVHYWTLSWARWIHWSSSHITHTFKICFIIITPPTPMSSKGFFPLGFHIKILNVFFISPIWFNHPHDIWDSPSSSAEVKNEWIYTCTSSVRLNGMDMDSYTCTFIVFSSYELCTSIC